MSGGFSPASGFTEHCKATTSLNCEYGPPASLSSSYRLGDWLVCGPMRNRRGDMSRVRVVYAVSEAIAPQLFEFWRSLGINLKQLCD